jgi:hypothetical protein
MHALRQFGAHQEQRADPLRDRPSESPRVLQSNDIRSHPEVESNASMGQPLTASSMVARSILVIVSMASKARFDFLGLSPIVGTPSKISNGCSF